MDWTPGEVQQAVSELAGDILAEGDQAWGALREAELLDLDDLLDIASLLIEVGRSGARVPVLPTLVLGAPIRAAGAAAGEVLTGGLLEPSSRDPRHPETRVQDGLIHGRKICVPAADQASRIVLPTRSGVYAAELSACDVELQEGTDGDPLGIVTLDGVPGERLGGDEVLNRWLSWVDVGISALLLGLSRKALELTAAYVTERTQFGRPVGSFQAVQQRAADAWIHTQVMEVSLWQAAWRVQQGLDSVRERAIARYWAAEGSHFVCAAAQHLHGGFGFDRDYELHRYFLAARQHEFILGGANHQLEQLGALLAEGTTGGG